MSDILIVDDEPQITRMLRTALQSAGHTVRVANDGEAAFDLFCSRAPDLVITDLAMPKMDGIELTAAIRRSAETPIIVLSVREADATKVRALDLGADDYLTKPFSMPELLARVRVQLRKLNAEAEPVRLAVGDFVIDTAAHSVTVRGQAVHLTPKEFDLLVHFAQAPGRVLTHRALLRAVWGPAGEQQPEYLRVLVASLRRKIESSEGEFRYIRSEPWVGYTFHPDGSDVAPGTPAAG